MQCLLHFLSCAFSSQWQPLHRANENTLWLAAGYAGYSISEALS